MCAPSVMGSVRLATVLAPEDLHAFRLCGAHQLYIFFQQRLSSRYAYELMEEEEKEEEGEGGKKALEKET